jgi:hypothetical protein
LRLIFLPGLVFVVGIDSTVGPCSAPSEQGEGYGDADATDPSDLDEVRSIFQCMGYGKVYELKASLGDQTAFEQ